MDSAHILDFEGYKYFLVMQGKCACEMPQNTVTDCKTFFSDLFSLRIWTFKIDAITSENAAECLKKVLENEPGLRIQLIQRDMGTGEKINQSKYIAS